MVSIALPSKAKLTYRHAIVALNTQLKRLTARTDTENIKKIKKMSQKRNSSPSLVKVASTPPTSDCKRARKTHWERILIPCQIFCLFFLDDMLLFKHTTGRKLCE